MKISKKNSVLYLVAVNSISIAAFTLSGCAETPQFRESVSSLKNQPVAGNTDGSGDSADGGSNSDGGSDDSRTIADPGSNTNTGDSTTGGSGGGSSEGGGGITPCTETTHAAIFTPSSIRGANIVFLIDDSGSMQEEIQGVIDQIQTFLAKISAATQGANYRVVLIYNHRESTFVSGSFLDQNGRPIDKTLHPNPLDYLIDGRKIFYFQSTTWSKWADIAFFQVFAPLNYVQTLPSVIPLDAPPTSLANANQIFAVKSPSSCTGPGKFFRPRFDHLDSNFNSTLACYDANTTNATYQHRSIAESLLPDVAVNFIVASDDDLNVNFDRTHFNFGSYDANDPNKNAYPEITYRMLQDIVRPLGANVPIFYHSLVGTTASNLISNIGTSHLALSKKTGGAIHEVEDFAGYQSAFNQITEKVIFSEQVVNLDCAVRANTTPNVSLGGVGLTSDQFSYSVGEKTIRLKPSVFSPSQINQTLNVSVNY